MTIPEQLLVLLMEECAEISQRASKCLRFGMSEIQPGDSNTNADRLRQEIADFTAILNLLGAAKVLIPPDSKEVSDLLTLKFEKIKKYMEYSEKMGRLNECECSSDDGLQDATMLDSRIPADVATT